MGRSDNGNNTKDNAETNEGGEHARDCAHPPSDTSMIVELGSKSSEAQSHLDQGQGLDSVFITCPTVVVGRNQDSALAMMASPDEDDLLPALPMISEVPCSTSAPAQDPKFGIADCLSQTVTCWWPKESAVIMENLMKRDVSELQPLLESRELLKAAVAQVRTELGLKAEEKKKSSEQYIASINGKWRRYYPDVADTDNPMKANPNLITFNNDTRREEYLDYGQFVDYEQEPINDNEPWHTEYRIMPVTSSDGRREDGRNHGWPRC